MFRSRRLSGLSIVFGSANRTRFCWFSKNGPTAPEMRVLNVAEKNDAAKNIAGHLSGGNLQRREGLSKFNKIYEFDHNFRGSPSTMIMTSVSGHLLGYEFQGLYRSWNSCSPLELFDIPVVKECPNDYLNIKKTLVREIRTCNTLVIWTDADREGENIGFEIIDVCKEVNPRIQIYRATLSEITRQSVQRAMANLGPPNKNISDAVDVRSELDLRIGAAFTRYQTMRLQKVFPEILAKSLISYGSCQFPTLGFVVERYKDIKNFIPENFWKIKVNHKIGELDVEYSWQRVRLFDELFCRVLYERCQENSTASVLKVTKKPKSKWRPVPLDTIELEKAASRKLGINAKETMKIAEKLYSQGFISYPRTETNIFPKDFNLTNLVQLQMEDNNWGDFAQRVLNDGPSPRQGKKSDQAHPPIHPTKYTHGLQDKERKVYEYVVRHFLACLSKDAEGEETIVNIEINGEKFLANGLRIIALNYLEVYPYDKWSNKQIHNYSQGQTFRPTGLEMVTGQTSPPNLLTEADLISLMDKHGIGTDATHAEHIETIKSRLYVGLENNKYFVPGELGIGLVEGYDDMGFDMSKPHLRAELEADLKKICEGTKLPSVVLREQVAKYKEVFIKTTEKLSADVLDPLRRLPSEPIFTVYCLAVVNRVLSLVEKLDQSLGKYLRTQPVAFQNNGQHESMTIKNLRKCPACKQASLVLKKKQNNPGFYITCINFPACKTTFWLPPTIIDAQVSDTACSQCHESTKLIKFQFSARSMRPHFPDAHEGCLNGCDPTLCEILQVNTSRVPVSFSNTQSTNRNNHTSSYSNTQPTNRNATTYQNRGPTNETNITRPTNNFSRITNNQPPNDDQVCCHCGTAAKQLTVTRETANKGRQFYGCSKPIAASDRCTFFLWADQPETSGPAQTQPQFNNRPNVQNNNGFMNNSYRARAGNNQPNAGGQGQRKCGRCKQTGHNRRNCPQN